MSFHLRFSLLLIFFCFNSQVSGENVYVAEDENTVIQWTITPAPGNVNVGVFHPSTEVLFSAYGTDVILGAGSASARVTYTGNTNTNTGQIEFTLNNIRATDAGDYKANFNQMSKDSPGGTTVLRVGATLVVYVKPSTPIITVVTDPIVGQDMVLQCSAASNSKPDGYLTMEYKWYKNNADLPTDSRYVMTGSQLQVTNIQKSDKTSIFTCKGYETSSLFSEASVGYAPSVKYGPDAVTLSPNTVRYDTEENDDIGTITCSADCNSPCTYQWKFNGGNVGGQSSTLSLNNIKPGQAGSYVCTATNNHGMGDSQTVAVTVKYGPKTVTLTPSNASYSLVEVTQNTLGPITCSTDCNPLCTYQWSRDGSVIRSEAVLELTGATRADDGTYRCNARNSYGNKASEKVRITVQYKPGNLKIEPSLFSYVLLESDKLGPINCSATCNPPCAYRWRRNNVDVIQTAVLDITRINRTQAGTYTCVATNKHGQIESNSVSVVVEYQPAEIMIRKIPSDENVKEHKTFSVICTTDSVPTPNITVWLNGEGKKIIYDKQKSLEVNFTKSAECLDTGEYVCVARNNHGNSTSSTVNINVLCSPEPPYNLRVKCDINEAKFEWISNFNGGVTQTFTINIQKSSQVHDTYTVADQGMDQRHEQNVLNLDPNTKYSFTVNANNSIGSSTIPPTIYCTTRPSKKEPGIPAALIGGIAGGTSFLLIIIVILAVVLLIKRRKSHKDENTELMNGGGMQLQDHPDDGMRQNILYESAGPSSQQQNTDCEYATVDKSTKKQNNSADVYATVDKSDKPQNDSSDVYAEVEKKGKKQKPDVKKAKPKGKQKTASETPSEEVYANFGGDFEDECASTSKAGANNKTGKGKTRTKTKPSAGKAGKGKSSSRRKNKEGLIYVDVEFGDPGKNKLNGIHGIEKRVDYVDIDFTRRADPLPSDDEEEDDGSKKNEENKPAEDVDE